MSQANTQFQTAAVYTDFGALKGLGAGARQGDPAAVKEVAKQFEAIFLQMMLAGMRKTINTDDEFSNEKNMYYDMFDKQIAMDLSARGGIGLADMMLRQMGIHQDPSETRFSNYVPGNIRPVNKQAISQHSGKSNAVTGEPVSTINTLPVKEGSRSAPAKSEDTTFTDPVDFVRKLWNTGKRYIVESGLDPRVVIAQAALETGWGKFMIRGKSGSSHNLFGIKAGKGWNGEQVVTSTLEYKNGMMQRIQAGFRAYRSIEESVKDYIKFLKSDDRYSQAIRQADNPALYARELQKAGYATDPNYADKILRIMNGKVFNDFFGSEKQ